MRVVVRLLGLGVLVGLLAWGLVRSQAGDTGERGFESRPRGIMGTTSTVVVVMPGDDEKQARAALERAEAELRRLEALMSTWIEVSEISRFNSSPAGDRVPLAKESREVLGAALRLSAETEGSFDITAQPLFELWRRARDEQEVPADREISKARATSSWELLELVDGGALKKAASVRIDIDGIAKGYAVDRALDLLRGSGATGGMVEVGGDLALFGTPPSGKQWRVTVRSPFSDGTLTDLVVESGAVCTSGGYARPIEIAGRSYSHILDPRSGRPVAAHPSVTVLAPDAMTADAWATALTVLGRPGLELLPPGVEALLVEGDRESYRVWVTRGISKRLRDAQFDPMPAL